MIVLCKMYSVGAHLCIAKRLIVVLILGHNVLSNYVKWVPCHHSMAHPQVVERGDTLQVWRVAANIFNKQLQTANKG
jgi:hypothetical protein